MIVEYAIIRNIRLRQHMWLKRPRRIFKKNFKPTSDEHCVIRSDKNITSKMSMHKQSGLTKIIVCTPATTSVI